jgi:penicillin-binding protein 2
MASYPSYNPSVFLPPAKNAGKLYKDKYNQPLIDKTLEPKAPGSTFKPITATAAWNSGVLGPGTTLDCPGVFYRPGDFSHTPFPNWTTANLGTMDLPTALEQSCNTFFFQLGSKMYDLPNQGIAFQKTIRQYGFGKTPPMDLPVSPYFSGLVPDAAWRLQTYSKPIDQVWQPGYDIQMAIGQGDLTVSPMQLAVAYSAIANGGKLVTPHIGKALLDSQGNVVKRFDPAPQRDLNLSPELLSEIRQGLYEASHSSLGTSSSVFGSYTPAVAGKTGTAEHPPDPSPNAWFASFAPADNPKLVVVALINDGGHGGVSAAPAARQVYQGFFHQKITNTVGTDASR